jgi:uncharacterized membrane protein YqjE
MDPGPSKRLLHRLHRMADLVLGLAQTRLELIGNELQLELLLAFDALMRGAAGLLLIAIGLLFFTAFVVALFWDSYRLVALGLSAGIFVAIGTALLLAARRRLQQVGQVFAASLAELAQDREQLRPPS